MKKGVVVDLTVKILREIRDDARKGFTELRQGFVELKHEVVQLNYRMDQLTGRVDHLTARFDHFLDFAGHRYRSHETRIEALEHAVFKKT